ncbi:MAG: glycoside hydrolase family 2, partial [Bacteroidetes bacterium]
MKFKLCFSLLLFIGLHSIIYGQEINQSDWTVIGRGITQYSSGEVTLQNNFMHGHKALPDNFEIQFHAKTPADAEQVQIWCGFGFQDRDNRYALGLRGGNSNDLYLCRYETLGKDKMLALESLDFDVSPGKSFHFKIVFIEGTIRIYLNEEKNARIIVKDETPLLNGFPVLGGGWMPATFSNFEVTELSEKTIAQFSKDTVLYNNDLTAAAKKVIRKKERAAYNNKKIYQVGPDRTEISLNGHWLFKPDYEIEDESTVKLPSTTDQDWHVMEVPQFWNPVRNWLHLQDSGLPHMGSGVSDNYREKEENRCNNYTFDYKKTTSAWYRHWIELPENIKDKTVKIQFDAVSKIAEVYVNGQYAGGNVGMFGYFDFDISRFLNPGKNLIAVHVKVRKYEKAEDAEENVARAVSVDITNDMLNSLPHGMFAGTEGGIWQPVKLIITNPVHITDVFAQVNMQGGDMHITCYNPTETPIARTIKLTIKQTELSRALYQSGSGREFRIPGGDSITYTYKLPKLNPNLWSPETPNLYNLNIQLWDGKLLEDQKQMRIGFREFEVRGNRFYLNGHPYWLRGANHPPCGIAPNDTLLANQFFKLMNEGNQIATRSHASPFTQTWMDAADRQGVAVSFEGTWPWFLIKNMPDKELITIWRKEFIKLVKRYRNHPSLFVWTVNNEMSFTMFYHGLSDEQRLENWTIISDVIKEIRTLHPGIPISGDSGYNRVPEDYEQNLKPNGIDDGDTDDRHVYFNWYNHDFFQIYDGEFGKRIYWSPGANPDRPYFGQEVSTGYPNNDVGHFCRKYIYKHYVPHAYYGDWAWEDHDPALGLKRHAFMSKELAEVMRRTSPEASGLLLFANVCWYQDVFQHDR